MEGGKEEERERKEGEERERRGGIEDQRERCSNENQRNNQIINKLKIDTK